MGFKGNCSVKVYNPSKPDKWGLQFKVLADSKTRYVYKLKLYDGEKSTILETVTNLVADLEYCNYILYMKNYYSSFNLALELLKNGIYTMGTLRKRREGPNLINTSNFKGVDKKA